MVRELVAPATRLDAAPVAGRLQSVHLALTRARAGRPQTGHVPTPAGDVRNRSDQLVQGERGGTTWKERRRKLQLK